MPNILFTDYCNLKCPYCFASEKVSQGATKSGGAGRYMNPDNLQICINFLKKAGVSSVGVIGGEPTLHPDFINMVDMLVNNGFFVKVFTNGLIDSFDKVEYLSSVDRNRLEVLLNINVPEQYTKAQYSIIKKVIKELKSKLFLGFNIYKKDFSIAFIEGLIDKHGLNKEIRLGLAHPIANGQNKFVTVSDYRAIAGKIVSEAERIEKKNMFFNLDCGFTLCMFTQAQLGKLVLSGTRFAFNLCANVIDIGVDLDVWRCFGMSDRENKKLSDFETLDEMHRYYNEKFMLYKRIGVKKECATCRHRIRGQCSAGCLSETMLSFNRG